MTNKILLEIGGQDVPSKKNSYRRGKYGGLYKPAKIVDYEKLAVIQIKQQLTNYTGKLPIVEPVKINALICRTRDADIDNGWQTVSDILEKAGVIENDKQVVELHLTKQKEKFGCVFLTIEKL